MARNMNANMIPLGSTPKAGGSIGGGGAGVSLLLPSYLTSNIKQEGKLLLLFNLLQ
jgi:hypothetical protein